MTMHAHDRHLARARSKAHMRDTSKDEARAFTRAVRRFGKVLTHMAKGDIRAASGATRWVLLVGPYAFKMPLLVHGGRLFLLGCLANISERSTSQEANGDLRLARTYACSPLGLLAVAERITGPLLLRRLTREEAISLPLQEFNGEAGVDDNGHNVATREDGSLVVLDYGNLDLMYVSNGPRLYRGQPR